MKQRTLVGLGLIAAGLGFVAGSARRGPRARGFFTGPLIHEPLISEPLIDEPPITEPHFGWSMGGPEARVELDAAPLVVVRGAFNEVSVAAGDGPRVLVDVADRNVQPAIFARRQKEGGRDAVVVDLIPRRRVEVTVPRGTALQLKFAKSRLAVTGLDDVEVHSAKGSIVLRDVAGAVNINSAVESVDVELSHERETRRVDAMLAKGRFALAIPAARGGDYRISAANCSVSAPPQVAGGIPINVRAARSKIAITAA